MKRIIYFILVCIAVLIIFLPSCWWRGNEKILDVQIDLKEIQKRGKLIAVTDFNSIDYFIYRGTPLGFQIEILEKLAVRLGVKFEVQTVRTFDEAFTYLEQGRCDLIAMSVPRTAQKMERYRFTTPLFRSRPVIVQRVDALNGKPLVSSISSLQGKKVFVQSESPYELKIRNIQEEYGIQMDIVGTEDTPEELVKQVSNSKIDFTIVSENIAAVNKMYCTNIDYSTTLGFYQDFCWVTRKKSLDLFSAVNSWLQRYKTTAEYSIIYQKYFDNSNKTARIVSSPYYSPKSGKISPFDNVLKKYSAVIEWDWRLIASLMYQESQFKKDVKSWSGAVGLMQIMPGTMNLLGLDSASTDEEHIKAGIRLIGMLDRQLAKTVVDKIERQKFVLAAYNVGLGHIYDAQRLARKYGRNPQKWDYHVGFFLSQKSKPKFYNDKVVKHGYCNGIIPNEYVSEILSRYNHYCNLQKSIAMIH